MDFDSLESEAETPLFLKNCPILEFSKEKPLNFAIQQFNKRRIEDNSSQKSTNFTKKWDFSLFPIIHEPSCCDSMSEFTMERFHNIEEKAISSIFAHDFLGLLEVLKQKVDLALNWQDFHGNSLLMLAVKLAYNHIDYVKIIKLLLEKGANARIRDYYGISAMEEALAQGDILTISMLFDSLVHENLKKYQIETMEIATQMLKLPDFSIEIKWEFESFIPFLSKLAPSDVFKIYKIGSSIRLDSNLIDFKLTGRKSRKLSLLFHNKRLLLLNRSNKIYCDIMQELDSEEKQALIYDLMNPDIKSSNIEIFDISIKENPGFFHKKTKIQGFLARKLEVSAVYKRTNLKKKHSYLTMKLEDYMKKTPKKEGLEEEKKKIKRFKQDLNIWMSEEFPIKLKDLEPLLRILSKGNKLIRDLKSFLEKNQKIKQEIIGFPIKTQIPLNFAVKAVINFMNYKEYGPGIRESQEFHDLFKIPDDFLLCDRKYAQKTMKYKSKRLFLADIFLS